MFARFFVDRPIFATVTETSATWTLGTLLEHLVEEKRAHEAGLRDGAPTAQPGDGPASHRA